MRLRDWNWLKVAVAVAACVVLLAGDMALASNMGFKMNKVIEPFTSGTCSNCQNWTALPYRHPYKDLEDVCDTLGLTPNNALSKVIVIDPSAGTTTSWPCGAVGLSPCVLKNQDGICSLLPVGSAPGTVMPDYLTHVGLIVQNNVLAGGMLVGSHAGNPPGSVTLKPLVTGVKGHNYFSVPYHTTSVHMQDVCNDLTLQDPGLVGGTVLRRSPTTGGITSWPCGGAGNPPGIFLGEALRVTYSGPDHPVAPGHPAHF